MLNLSKITALFFCIVLFSCANLFAQNPDLDAVKPEFAKMDTDKDGFVSFSEMQAYQAQRFQELDQDKSGSVDSEELVVDKTKMFQKADADKDAKIIPAESSSQFTEYFNQMDKDNDNKISEQEYTDYWKGIYYF